MIETQNENERSEPVFQNDEQSTVEPIITYLGSIPMPASQPKKSKKLIILSAFLLVVAFIAFGAWKLLSSKISRVDGVNFSTAKGEALIGKSVKNNYRVYKTMPKVSNSSGTIQKQTAMYTLVDENGNKIKEASASTEASMVIPVGSDHFLFAFTGAGVGNHTLFGKDGFKDLVNVPDSMKYGSSDGISGGPVSLSNFGDSSVVYQYCKDTERIDVGAEPYQCDMRVVDLETAKEKIMSLPSEFKDYSARLKAISEDKKTAYFFGTSKKDAEDFAKESKSITGDKIRYQNDPGIKKVYSLKLKHSVIALDLTTQKVVSNKTVETQYTYYQKYWLSPNGEHLVYSNGGENGILQYVSVLDGKVGTIKLPDAGQSTEPWGGRTVTYDPIFSEDGNYMAYVTYVNKSGKFLESMGVIDLKKRTSQEYAIDMVGSSPSSAEKYFNNMRWFGAGQLEYTAGQKNYHLDTSVGTPKLISENNGLLVGIADGIR